MFLPCPLQKRSPFIAIDAEAPVGFRNAALAFTVSAVKADSATIPDIKLFFMMINISIGDDSFCAG